MAAFAPAAAGRLFQFNGEVIRPEHGWSGLGADHHTPIPIPTSGLNVDTWPGTVCSPFVPAPGAGSNNSCLRLRFTARVRETGYWWLEFRDAAGAWLPDCNSALYADAETWRHYDEIIMLPQDVHELQIRFVSSTVVKIRDLTLSQCTLAEAAVWCDSIYARMPALPATLPQPETTRGLERSAVALRSGTPWRVMLLGDSIVNDSFTSLFAALVQRHYPRAVLSWTVSVKGSTGCLFYAKEENYRQYIARHQPDLLLIGGISHFQADNASERQAFADVMRRAQTETGCEVAIMTPAPSVVPQLKAGCTAPWRQLAERPEMRNYLDCSPHRAIAIETGVALWDLTTSLQDYLEAHPQMSRNRDVIHNDDLGKQLIGRRLAECFAALNLR